MLPKPTVPHEGSVVDLTQVCRATEWVGTVAERKYKDWLVMERMFFRFGVQGGSQACRLPDHCPALRVARAAVIFLDGQSGQVGAKCKMFYSFRCYFGQLSQGADRGAEEHMSVYLYQVGLLISTFEASSMYVCIDSSTGSESRFYSRRASKKLSKAVQ
ncbi:jg165 [Pararge aegeria aegeria]|uniref:Jg165 protein n=1 Tax=Pararge aegeria aegeria TaxID=348720 RepID=A0A8S4QLE2_9NEOP|nr:jg165 [Pararge aegeria aegeria]